ncbi:hypothetical protein [Streptomyces sp. NPDC058657]|uniref:hypothetical protein n=1 Tax=unclassified Streptomyces TaxID=2593676 RepID=UPI00366059D2
MIWWLKVRGVRATLFGTLAALVLSALVPQEAIPLPSLVGSVGGILVVQLLGLLPAFLMLYGIDRGDPSAEEVAVRHSPRLSLALCCAFALATGIVSLVFHLALDRPETLSLARNSIGFLAAALIVRALLGAGVAVICVAALPIACAVAGRGAGGVALPWAWPIHEPTSVLAVAEVAVLFVVASGLLVRRSRPLHDPL